MSGITDRIAAEKEAEERGVRRERARVLELLRDSGAPSSVVVEVARPSAAYEQDTEDYVREIAVKIYALCVTDKRELAVDIDPIKKFLREVLKAGILTGHSEMKARVEAYVRSRHMAAQQDADTDPHLTTEQRQQWRERAVGIFEILNGVLNGALERMD